jgi:hypothetical protein
MTEPYPIGPSARNAGTARTTAKMAGSAPRLDVMLRRPAGARPPSARPLAALASVEPPSAIIGRSAHGQGLPMSATLPFASILDRPYQALEAQPDRCAYPWRGAPDGVTFANGRMYGACSCECGCRRRERKYYRCANCAHGTHYRPNPLPIPVAIRSARAFGDFDHGPGTGQARPPHAAPTRPAPLHRREPERAAGSPNHAPNPAHTRRAAAS